MPRPARLSRWSHRVCVVCLCVCDVCL
jgi:hypothetical protein